MKILFFNHHPDEMYWHIKTFESLGHDCHVATRKLTLESGEDYCSFNEQGKVQKGPAFHEWKDLYPDMNLKFTDTTDGFEAAVTISGKIPRILSEKMKVFAFICVYYDIHKHTNEKNIVKIVPHPDAQNWNGHFIPKFVPPYGMIGKHNNVSQLMERFQTRYFNEMYQLKLMGYPIIIAGAKESPDGVVPDLETLKNSRFLVHDKNYGISCNAILKALDSGCMIYISRQNRIQNGLTDIPDECFIFSDDISIKDAYHLYENYDKQKIQNMFRNVRNIENAKKYLLKVIT